MKRLALNTLSIIALISLTLSSCSGPMPPAEKEALVDQMFRDYDLPDGPGASVLVFKDDSVIYEKSFGLASLEEGQHITPTTNFRLASVTKQFTAACILLLASESKISLDDPIKRFFPGFPPYGQSITVRHLLTHTSGIVDYESLMPDTQTVQIHDEGVLRLLSSIDSTYFSPGEKFSYSNSGFSLLSLIVERVSGQPFAKFLYSHIFHPLGMEGTVAFEKGISTVPNRAFGYSRTDSGWVFADQSPTSAVLGDGGIYSSVGDLRLWNKALSEGRVLPPSLQKEAWTSATLLDGSKTDYGYGWYLDPYEDMSRQYHTGSTRGFRNVLMRFPEQRLTIIILTNRNEGEPARIAEGIAELYLNND